MRLVFAGTPSTALPSLDALLSSRHEVVAVISRPDRPAGRGRSLSSSPVAQRARELDLRLLQPARLDEPFIRELRDLGPDCCPVVAYGALIPSTALSVPVHGWVNLHFSLLPAWRGAAPVQHAILSGDEVTGATTFQIEEGLDTGPIFGVLTEQIRARDTAGALLDRLAVAGARLLVETMDHIEDGSAAAVPQPTDGVSTAPKLRPDDIRINWSQPALAIDRLVRAGTPAPGAWTTFRGKRIKISPVRITTDEHVVPGELAVDQKGVSVGTGSAPVQLGDVQSEGKAGMSALDWARGVRPQPGERFE